MNQLAVVSIRTQIETVKEVREGFDVVVFDADTGQMNIRLRSLSSAPSVSPQKQMKREVLRLGGYTREFLVSQTPELTQMADVVIDLTARVMAGATRTASAVSV